MKLIWLILIILITALQYRLWIAESSIPRNLELVEAIEQQAVANEELKERNKVLRAVTNGLVADQQTIEGIARERLGMIQKDETLFLVFDENGNIPETKQETATESTWDSSYRFPEVPEMPVPVKTEVQDE